MTHNVYFHRGWPGEPVERWPSSGQHIRRQNLLSLIDRNGGPKGLDLRGATFLGDGPEEDPSLNPIDLSQESIQQLADRTSTPGTTKPLWLSPSTGGIALEQARLEGADLRHANLEGAGLRWTNLRGAHLWSATLRHAELRDADLQQADLRYADLQGASLRECRLQGSDLRRANLRGGRWQDVFVDRTRMYHEQFGGPLQDEFDAKRGTRTYDTPRVAYVGLKANFLSLGQYEDAAWAHIKERQMEKMGYYRQCFPQLPGTWQNPLHWFLFSSLRHRQWRRWLRAWRRWYWFRRRSWSLVFKNWTSLLRWVRNWAYELLAGYGERPILPLVWAAVLAVLAYPLLYWAIGALPGHGRAFTSSSASDVDWAGWGESVIFSLTSFGTLSFSRLQPDGTLPNTVAAFEAFTGVLLFALFIFTLGNRMGRS